MAEERIPCGTEGCENTIQPATVERNDGLCGSCYNRVKQQEREEHIRKNRRDVNLYEGVTDPVEMITVLHQPRKYDPLINYLPSPKSAEQLYGELTQEQAMRLMELAVAELSKEKGGITDDIARCLAAFTDHCLDFMLAKFVRRENFWPLIAFRNAGERIAKEVIRNLPNDELGIDHALRCLAWIGSCEVVDFFADAERKPPKWVDLLRVAPGQYAHEAGWELREGRMHKLYYDECLAIALSPKGVEGDPAVKAMQEVGGDCPWCSRRLVDMFRLDLKNSRLSFLPNIGNQLCVLTCDSCSCFGDGLYSRQAESGDWHWAEENSPPAYLPTTDEEWDVSPWNNVSLNLSVRNPLQAADWLLPTTFSQLGGLPTWIQDTAYPSCCACGQTMTFVGQLDNGVFPYYEGIHYAFLCPDCRVVATNYQQT